MDEVIVARARELELDLPPAEAFESVTGRGVRATVGGRGYAAGGPALLTQRDLDVPPDLAAQARAWGERGQTVIYLVATDGSPSGHPAGRVLAAFALADVLRPESRAAVADLQRQGLRVVMLTGDSAAVARWVAAELGIDEVLAQVLPQDKSAKVRELHARGLRVARSPWGRAGSAAVRGEWRHPGPRSQKRSPPPAAAGPGASRNR